MLKAVGNVIPTAFCLTAICLLPTSESSPVPHADQLFDGGRGAARLDAADEVGVNAVVAHADELFELEVRVAEVAQLADEVDRDAVVAGADELFERERVVAFGAQLLDEVGGHAVVADANQTFERGYVEARGAYLADEGGR